MSTLEEIKTAIAGLNARDRALLAAELLGTEMSPDERALEVALNRGLEDVAAARVREAENVREMIPRWTTKS